MVYANQSTLCRGHVQKKYFFRFVPIATKLRVRVRVPNFDVDVGQKMRMPRGPVSYRSFNTVVSLVWVFKCSC